MPEYKRINHEVVYEHIDKELESEASDAKQINKKENKKLLRFSISK